MRWFKMYGEARNDAKLRILTDDQFRTWFNLMCLASEQDDCGIISGYSDLLLAVEVCNGDVTLLSVTLEKLVTLRIVTVTDGLEITFVKFADRQHDTKSNSKENIAERVRKHRENKKKGPSEPENTPDEAKSGQCNDDVTGCNALQGECNGLEERRGEENRGEEKRDDVPAAAENLSSVSKNPEILESVLFALGKERDWQMSRIGSLDKIKIHQIVELVLEVGDTADDVRRWREHDFPAFLNKPPSEVSNPTPPQMLSQYQTVKERAAKKKTAASGAIDFKEVERLRQMSRDHNAKLTGVLQ